MGCSRWFHEGWYFPFLGSFSQGIFKTGSTMNQILLLFLYCKSEYLFNYILAVSFFYFYALLPSSSFSLHHPQLCMDVSGRERWERFYTPAIAWPCLVDTPTTTTMVLFLPQSLETEHISLCCFSHASIILASLWFFWVFPSSPSHPYRITGITRMLFCLAFKWALENQIWGLKLG